MKVIVYSSLLNMCLFQTTRVMLIATGALAVATQLPGTTRSLLPTTPLTCRTWTPLVLPVRAPVLPINTLPLITVSYPHQC